MTLPRERTRAVMATKEFLAALASPRMTKRIPKEIRQIASALARHYPWWFELGHAEYWDKEVALEWQERFLREWREETAGRWLKVSLDDQ